MKFQSHYSIKGAAAVTGIGTDNCFNIPTDSRGRMIPEALEQRILQCKRDGILLEFFFLHKNLLFSTIKILALKDD